jgi:hypothetical protein
MDNRLTDRADEQSGETAMTATVISGAAARA